MKEYAFGIDLGGTTAKIGLFKTTGELLEKWEVPTDTSNAGEHILKNLAAAVQGKMQEKGLAAEQVEGVGVGVPGPVLDSRIVPTPSTCSAARRGRGRARPCAGQPHRAHHLRKPRRLGQA